MSIHEARRGWKRVPILVQGVPVGRAIDQTAVPAHYQQRVDVRSGRALQRGQNLVVVLADLLSGIEHLLDPEALAVLHLSAEREDRKQVVADLKVVGTCETVTAGLRRAVAVLLLEGRPGRVDDLVGAQQLEGVALSFAPARSTNPLGLRLRAVVELSFRHVLLHLMQF